MKRTELNLALTGDISDFEGWDAGNCTPALTSTPSAASTAVTTSTPVNSENAESCVLTLYIDNKPHGIFCEVYYLCHIHDPIQLHMGGVKCVVALFVGVEAVHVDDINKVHFSFRVS